MVGFGAGNDLDTSVIVITLLCGALSLLIVYYFFSTQQNAISSKYKPIPRIFAYDPAIRALITGSLGNLPEKHRIYGDLIQLRFIGEPAVLVGGLSNLRTVLNADHSSVRADLPKPMIKLLGIGNLQTIHGQEHAAARKMLAPFFRPSNLQSYIARLSHLATEMVANWATACANSSTVSGYQEIRKYVIRAALELVLGFDERTTSEAEYSSMSQLYVDLWKGFFTIPVDLPGTPFRKAIKARNGLQATILRNLQNLVETTAAPPANSTATTTEEDLTRTTDEAHQKIDDDTKNPSPLFKSGLHHLMAGADENGSPIPHPQILELVTGLMLGAVDTTSTVLLLALRRLTMHPEVLERAHREQLTAVSEHGSEWTEASLRSMKYLDSVLKETVRLQSPVQIVFRRAVKDLEVGQYCVPAGMKLLCNVGESITHDARWVDNPNCKEFLPERWLEEDGARIGGWLPFGGGVRLCPGQSLAWLEMKLMLGVVVRSYTVSLVEPDEKWSEFPLMTPLRGMPIDVRKRAV